MTVFRFSRPSIATALGGSSAARGLPPAPTTLEANSTQIRAESTQSDRVLLRESLQGSQVAAVIGNTVPLVFCREVGGAGGVMVSPPCVRAGFQKTADGTISANYLCVVSDGQLASISLADVWHGGRKLNTLSDYSYGQGYGVIPSGLALSSYFENGEDAYNYPLETGSGGSMAGLTLLGVRATYGPDDGDSWNQQVHAFVRSGYPVTRLIDNTLGPSNNFADLVKLLIELSGRVSASLIDNDTLLTAAKFTQAESFFYNGVLASSVGLKDFLSRLAPLFMLNISSKNGKIGLLPALPYTASFAIDKGIINPSASYGMEDMVAGSYSQQFVPLAERKFFRAVMNWREQPASNASVVRTTTVGYTGYAVDGPFETYDLSEFCTTESHAIKIGRFIVAQRKYTTHTIQFALKPERAFHEPGDIIRVTLNRITSADDSLAFSRLYMITAVTEQPTGETIISAAHFPVDANGKSLVANEIVSTALLTPQPAEDQCPDPPPSDEPNNDEVPYDGNYIVAFGGTVTTDGNYKIHTFTSSNTFVVAYVPEGETIQYLIVGGGGSGSRGGGGGGGGAVVTGTFSPAETGYPVVVGQGGTMAPQPFYYVSAEQDGKASSIFGFTAAGGKGGPISSVQASGTFNNGGASGNGKAGGIGTVGSRIDATGPDAGGGGGGGAGGGGSSGIPGIGGNGGPGLASSISGVSVTYGGGGGGAARAGSGGAGGSGGGGVGGGASANATSGASNTGGGGGAISVLGVSSNGGSGIVIVRYRYQ